MENHVLEKRAKTNLPSIAPEKAWQMVLGKLQLEMPKVYYDTWVKDTEFLSFNNGLVTIGAANDYVKEWLSNRLTSTLSRALTGILAQEVEVEFVVQEYSLGDEEEPKIEDPGEDEIQESEKPLATLTLKAEYQSVYDEIVQPEQVIVIPGYFLRFISLLGLELAWLYVGFRQAAYMAGASRNPGKKVGAPAQRVAQFAGMSLRTFRRYAAKEETWQRLSGLVSRVDDGPHWKQGDDQHPHRLPRYYRVAMTLPLTTADAVSLRAWLYHRLAQGKAPLDVLREALMIPPNELIPQEMNIAAGKAGKSELHSVQEIVSAVCGPVVEKDRVTFQQLADQLAQHLMPPNDLIVLTHYFVTRWLPRLGPGPGWFVTLLRDRCYYNRRTGEVRDEVRLEQGYAETAQKLGLRRAKTVWEWLREPDVARFIREIEHEAVDWEAGPRRFKVIVGEPLTEEDQIRMEERLCQRGIGAVVTHNGRIDTIRNRLAGEMVGANDTISGAVGTIRTGSSDGPIGAVVTHSGAVDTNRNKANRSFIGATGTSNGALDTIFGGNDTNRIGAVGTLDWRDWHCFNSLTPGLKHKENTKSTTTAEVVAGAWDLEVLLALNRVSLRTQELLVKKGSSATAFVSWLIYAAGKSGNTLRDPVGHAVSRLAQDSPQGAGGAYDRLAKLMPEDFAALIERELGWQSPRDEDWRAVMEGAPHVRLRTLAEQLGLPVLDSDIS